MSLHQRLARAIQDYWSPANGEPTVAAFTREMARRLEEVPNAGTSRPSIDSYLKGSSEPSLLFLNHAADVLHVRLEWLVLGRGMPTEKQQLAHDAQGVRHQLRRKRDEEIYKFVQGLPGVAYTHGENTWAARNDDMRRDAVLRLHRSLTDALFPSFAFGLKSAPEHQFDDVLRFILGEAMRFLVAVDTSFLPPDDEDRLSHEASLRAATVLSHSDAQGWYVQWADRVLSLFASRLIGIGIRSGEVDDTHSPVAASRGRTRMDAGES